MPVRLMSDRRSREAAQLDLPGLLAMVEHREDRRTFLFASADLRSDFAQEKRP
jgi:hypothetical protein